MLETCYLGENLTAEIGLLEQLDPRSESPELPFFNKPTG